MKFHQGKMTIEAQIVQSKIVQVLCDEQNPHSVELMEVIKQKYLDSKLGSTSIFEEAVNELRRYHRYRLSQIHFIPEEQRVRVSPDEVQTSQ